MSNIQYQGIIRFGTVTIKENEVIVSDFTFFECGISEALKWAIQQIEGELAEHERSLAPSKPNNLTAPPKPAPKGYDLYL